MSLTVTASELTRHVAPIHECSRWRWGKYRDCPGCQEVQRDYDQQRHARLKPERQQRARERYERLKAQREAEADLRCPCQSCRDSA